MSLPQELAKQIRSFHTGPNWTASHLKAQLEGLSWEQAITPLHGLNSIAVLVYHIHYYIRAILEVLEGGELNAHDKFAFDMPPIHSQADWEGMLAKQAEEVERFLALLEQMPESQLWENMADPKYGHYFRNLQGTLEHSYYHLGQIALIKKMLMQA